MKAKGRNEGWNKKGKGKKGRKGEKKEEERIRNTVVSLSVILLHFRYLH